MKDELNGYDLSRSWFDFCFENPEKVKPVHTALYFFAIEHCNRLGWKKKFGLPTTMAMEALGVKSYNTYSETLKDLVEWKFISMIEKSRNQYSSNIVALSNFDKALYKALDKALIKHGAKQGSKQGESTEQSIDSIDKQETIEQLNNEQLNHLGASPETEEKEADPEPVETEEGKRKKVAAKKEKDREEVANRVLSQCGFIPVDPKYAETWKQLCKMPKWKSKPEVSLQASIKKLIEFEERFAIDLMQAAIEGNYQGVVFPDTKVKYQEFLNGNQNGIIKTLRNQESRAGREQGRAAMGHLAQAALDGIASKYSG